MGKFFVISGDDEFSRKQRVREIIGELAGDNPEDNPALEIISGDAPDAKDSVVAGRFLEALRTPPFLCDNKIIWLRHFSDLAPFNENNPAEPYSEIIAFLSEPLPPEVHVVIDGPGLDQRKSFAKALKAAGAVMESKAVAKTTDRNYADSRRMEYAVVSLMALRNYPCERTLQILSRHLHNPNWYIRYNATESMEMLGIEYQDLLDVFDGQDRYAREMLQYRFDQRYILEKEVGE